MTDINSKVLHDTIKAAFYIASSDNARPHISGILLDCTTRSLCTVVATDGHSLVSIDTDWSLGGADMLLSAEGVKDLLYQLAPLAKPKTARLVSFDGTSLDGRPIATSSERFPPYRQVIPSTDNKDRAQYVGLSVSLLTRTAKVFEQGVKLVTGADPLDPIVMRGLTTHKYEATYVQMPMRI